MIHRNAMIALAAFAASCTTMGPGSQPTAVANLEATKGNSVTGRATFVQEGDGVHVKVSLSGLPPNSEHGFHVHEKGDCSSGDGMSTGGHFNPDGKPHGPQAGEHHAGDMPGLMADSYGNVETSFVLHGVTVGGGGADLVGRGLIVHRDPDDYKTQPTGNSGPRVACGVIVKTH
ncbi:MAG TPA: superoxide dismutase family protein [Usitatibacter sp.]|nr:superoxide dismutase family protein [Usitatibacter sp.]